MYYLSYWLVMSLQEIKDAANVEPRKNQDQEVELLEGDQRSYYRSLNPRHPS